MPRQRLTPEKAALKGADRKDPARFADRKAAPKSELPLGDAPKHFNASQKAAWFEFSAYAIPGTLTGADRISLEGASVLLAEFRSDPSGFAAAKYGRLFQYLSAFGMTPVDRQKLGAVKPAESANPFDDLDS